MSREATRTRSRPDGPGDPEALLRVLLGECLRRGEREGLSAIADVFRRHPAHADALRRRLKLLMEFGLFQPRD